MSVLFQFYRKATISGSTYHGERNLVLCHEELSRDRDPSLLTALSRINSYLWMSGRPGVMQQAFGGIRIEFEYPTVLAQGQALKKTMHFSSPSVRKRVWRRLMRKPKALFCYKFENGQGYAEVIGMFGDEFQLAWAQLEHGLRMFGEKIQACHKLRKINALSFGEKRNYLGAQREIKGFEKDLAHQIRMIFQPNIRRK